MYPYIRLASLTEFDDITISDFLNKQPEGYLEFFTPFDFSEQSIRKEIEENFFVLIFIGERLVSMSFARFHPDYDSPTTGNVTDFNYQNKSLAQLGLIYLKSYLKLANKDTNFKAHISEQNKNALLLAEKTGIEWLN